MKEDKHKLDFTHVAIGLEHGRGYKIEYSLDPTFTHHLLRGTYPSLQQAKEHFRKWRNGYLYGRDRLGKFESKKVSR